MSRTLRTRALASVLAVTTAALLVAAGPAQGMPTEPSGGQDGACWLNADSAIVQCFSDEDAMRDAVTTQTRTVLLDPESMSASRAPAAQATSYILVKFYADANYLGAVLSVTSTSSTICTSGGSVTNDLTGAWNDRVSSFKSFYSCSTRIYQNTGQSGSWFGYSVNAPAVGALNDQASSFRVQ